MESAAPATQPAGPGAPRRSGTAGACSRPFSGEPCLAAIVNHAQLNPQQLQCYIHANHTSSNRQPGRLAIAVTIRKQTTGARLNRQLSRTSRIQLSSGGIPNQMLGHGSQVTNYELGLSFKQRRTCGKCEKTTDSRIGPQFPRSLLFSSLRALSDWQTTCPSA